MITEGSFRLAIELVQPARSVLVTTHTKPDGDACGCLAAIVAWLRHLGKQVTPLFLDPVPDWYSFLVPEGSQFLGDLNRWDPAGKFDLVVLVDVNSLGQLPGLEGYIQSGRAKVLVLDHHVTSDGLGTAELVDPTAAATGVVALELARFGNWPIDAQVAQALFVAIATDTGWFQFSNTDGRAFRACADLIDVGVRPSEVYARLYQRFPYSRFRLMVAMLNSLQLHFDGRLALLTLRRMDFLQTGCTYEHTENLINEAHRISTVRASVLLVELEDGRIRCSLRSRSPVEGRGPAVDVSQIAASFGGGGHKNAAGAYLDGPIERATKVILEAFSLHIRD